MYKRRVDQQSADSAAVARVLGGESGAFAELVDRYREAAFRAAYLIVRDSATAEDVTQEAFVRAMLNLRQFRDGELFRPWLLRITTNLALNEVRGRTRRQGLLGRLGFQRTTSPPPEDEVIADEQGRLLRRAIDELREEDRVVLYLRHYLELPEREIAAVLDCAPGTVKSRLHRASARLREVIDARYPGLRPGSEGGSRA